MLKLMLLLLAAAIPQAAPPPPSDGLPAPKSSAVSQQRCKCPCGSAICRCASMGGCQLKPKAAAQPRAFKSGQQWDGGIVLPSPGAAQPRQGYPVRGGWWGPREGEEPRKAVYRTETQRVKICTGGRCYFEDRQMTVFDHWEQAPVESSAPLATDGAAHTPLAEVNRVLALLPQPQVAFVDFGCGFDARWCVAAAERWKCRVIGVEIDPERAASARERVRNLGLDKLITIVEGDAETVDVQGDVAVAYLYPELLVRLKPRLERFSAVASYMHNVPGLPMQKNGDTWIYRRGVALQMQSGPRGAVWNGMVYSGPQCNNLNCPMCASIRRQLSGK